MLNDIKYAITSSHQDEIVSMALHRHFSRQLMDKFSEQNNVSMARCYAEDDLCLTTRLQIIGKTMKDVTDVIDAMVKGSALMAEYSEETLQQKAVAAQNAANEAQRLANAAQRLATTARQLAHYTPIDASAFTRALLNRM